MSDLLCQHALEGLLQLNKSLLLVQNHHLVRLAIWSISEKWLFHVAGKSGTCVKRRGWSSSWYSSTRTAHRTECNEVSVVDEDRVSVSRSYSDTASMGTLTRKAVMRLRLARAWTYDETKEHKTGLDGGAYGGHVSAGVPPSYKASAGILPWQPFWYRDTSRRRRHPSFLGPP